MMFWHTMCDGGGGHVYVVCRPIVSAHICVCANITHSPRRLSGNDASHPCVRAARRRPPVCRNVVSRVHTIGTRVRGVFVTHIAVHIIYIAHTYRTPGPSPLPPPPAAYQSVVVCGLCCAGIHNTHMCAVAAL